MESTWDIIVWGKFMVLQTWRHDWFQSFCLFLSIGVCHDKKKRRTCNIVYWQYSCRPSWHTILLRNKCSHHGIKFGSFVIGSWVRKMTQRLLMHLIKTSSSWIDSWEVYKTIKDWCSGEVIHSVVLLISQRYSEDRNNPDAHWYTLNSVGRDPGI